MSKFPFMPLFLGDLLSDTLHLSSQEFGAYVLLFCHAWKHEAKMTVKDAQKIGRVGNRHWRAVRVKLAPFFEPSSGLLGGALEVVHPRVAKELAKAAELSNKRKGAAVQLHIKKRASASVLHAVCIPTPSQSPKKNGAARSLAPRAGNGALAHAPSAAYRPSGMSPDPGDNYRASPSPFKSDNLLQPIPDKPAMVKAVKSRADKSPVQITDELKELLARTVKRTERKRRKNKQAEVNGG